MSHNLRIGLVYFEDFSFSIQLPYSGVKPAKSNIEARNYAKTKLLPKSWSDLIKLLRERNICIGTYKVPVQVLQT